MNTICKKDEMFAYTTRIISINNNKKKTTIFIFTTNIYPKSERDSSNTALGCNRASKLHEIEVIDIHVL